VLHEGIFSKRSGLSFWAYGAEEALKVLGRTLHTSSKPVLSAKSSPTSPPPPTHTITMGFFSIPSCPTCIRRLAGGALHQIRGKKRTRKVPTITVQLTRDVPKFGKQGTTTRWMAPGIGGDQLTIHRDCPTNPKRKNEEYAGIDPCHYLSFC